MRYSDLPPPHCLLVLKCVSPNGVLRLCAARAQSDGGGVCLRISGDTGSGRRSLWNGMGLTGDGSILEFLAWFARWTRLVGLRINTSTCLDSRERSEPAEG